MMNNRRRWFRESWEGNIYKEGKGGESGFPRRRGHRRQLRYRHGREGQSHGVFSFCNLEFGRGFRGRLYGG